MFSDEENELVVSKFFEIAGKYLAISNNPSNESTEGETK